MKPTRTGLLLLLLLVLLGAPALVAAFTPPGPPPLWHQNAMRMSYREELLSPPTERELEALERRLAPSAAAWLRLASAVVMGGAYLASPVMAPRPAEAATSTTVLAGNVMESTCLGFGCGSYQGQDFNGAARPSDEPSIDMQAFLKAVDDKRIVNVELLDGGNIAYATVREASTGEAGGATSRLRIGEGFPVDNPKAWSSPLWVVRILKDKQIPYTLQIDFKGAALGGSRAGPPQF